ncbi:MAG: hypothetical protein K0B01_13605 [Syntrophobacterales bacterium]|nr:hypothetical protein [Syntrophobacterales bacterium]
MTKMLRMTGLVIVSVVFAAGSALAAGSADVTYGKDVKKIISEHCLACHGSDAPAMVDFKKDKAAYKKAMKGPKADSYASLMVMVNGTDTGALMRRLDDGKNTKNGKPGNMYDYLGSSDAEKAANLKVIKDWVGGWTLKRAKDITQDELKAIKALEK